jgi:hypothetical protein
MALNIKASQPPKIPRKTPMKKPTSILPKGIAQT